MIIIKTSNGDAFVNEAEMQQVEHLRDKRQVKITTRVGVRTINDVEAVLYATNISQWQDEGSQVAKLHSLVTQLEHERTIRVEAYRQLHDLFEQENNDLRQAVKAIEDGVEDWAERFLKDKWERIVYRRTQVENLEKNISDQEANTRKIAQEQIEQDNELERQRQQEREEQENLINVLRHQVMDADLMLGRMKNRSLWQRIRNKV